MFRRLLYQNYKLFFLVNQKVKKRFSPHGLMIFAVMCAAGIFGIDTRATLSFQIFSFTLIMLLMALLYMLFFRGRFNVTRKLPEYGTVGQTLKYSIIVSNRDARPHKNLLLTDDLKNEFPDFNYFIKTRDPLDKKRNRIDRYLGYPRLVNTLRKLRGGNIKSKLIRHIAEKSDIDVKLELLPLRRGYLHFDKCTLASTDPMGLCHALRTFNLKDKLLVLPKLYQAPRLDLPGHRVYQPGGTNKASLSGDSQEFISLREYRPGDPLRSIHWRSYARHGVPVVKEYQDEYFVRYGLILDTYLDTTVDRDIFEEAVSIAASFMVGQRDQDTLMDLMFIDNRAYRYTSGKSHHHINAILEVLACIEPEPDSNLARLQELLRKHIRECCGLVCILLALDEERLSLLRFLDDYSIPVKALVLNNDDADPVTIQFRNIDIHYINSSRVQQDLDKMVARAVAA